MFDGGMVGWLIVFLFKAKGLGQRAISIGLSAISLVGMGAIAFADLFLSGQDLTQIPANLGTMVVWGIGGMTFIHVIGVWGFHISEPETMQEIKLQTQEDQIVDEAIKQTETTLEARAMSLAAVISKRMEAKALYRLGLLNAENPVIDVESRDVVSPIQAMPAPTPKRGLFSRWFGGSKPEPVQATANPMLAEMYAWMKAQQAQSTPAVNVNAAETVIPPEVKPDPTPPPV